MGFAALWILFFHEWIPLFDPVGLRFVESFIKKIGFCGVDIFFFLSGMGLYFSIQSHSTLQFYVRRIRRIAIPFLVIAVLRCVTDHWTVWQLLKNVSGYCFYTENIYSLLWFVPAIVTLYLLFPIYYKLFTSSSNKTIFTLCVLIIWLLVSIALRNTMRTDLYGFTNRIPVFCVGTLMGYWSRQQDIRFTRAIWILLSLTLILGLYLSYLTNYQDMQILVPVSNCCVPNFLMAISLSFLIPKVLALLRSVSNTKAVECVLARILSFFGMFSLELYCVQEWLAALIQPQLALYFGTLMVNIIIFTSVTIAGLLLCLIQNKVWMLIDHLHDMKVNAK